MKKIGALVSIMLLALTAFAQSKSWIVPTHKPLLADIHYSNRVGGEIAQEGRTQKLICLEKDSRLTSIQVNVTAAKNVVKGLKMSIRDANNLERILAFGDTTGIWQEKITLKRNQKLVGISGQSGWFIDAIRFHFSEGSQTRLFGGRGGDVAFSQIFNRSKKGYYKGRWIGFYGSSTDQLETIGLVFMAVE